jgi:prepilin-type processing-associated H-X9-DG protein
MGYISSHDGQSTTVMITENIDATLWTSTSSIRIGFVWLDIESNRRGQFGINSNKGDGPAVVPPGSPPFWEVVYGEQEFRFSRPSSNHPGVVNVAFCDAHVRTIGESIDYLVWAQLMTSWGARATNSLTKAPPQHVQVHKHVLSEGDIP